MLFVIVPSLVAEEKEFHSANMELIQSNLCQMLTNNQIINTCGGKLLHRKAKAFSLIIYKTCRDVNRKYFPAIESPEWHAKLDKHFQC